MAIHRHKANAIALALFYGFVYVIMNAVNLDRWGQFFLLIRSDECCWVK